MVCTSVLLGGPNLADPVSGQSRLNPMEERKAEQDLRASVASDDPAERMKALKSLTPLKNPEHFDYLLEALNDPDVRVKAWAIDECGDLNAVQSVPLLTQALFMRAHDPRLDQRILVSLGKIGDPRAAEPIIEYLEHDLDPATRGAAIFALGDLRTPESLEILVAIEQADEDPTMRRLAREAAAKFKRE